MRYNRGLGGYGGTLKRVPSSMLFTFEHGGWSKKWSVEATVVGRAVAVGLCGGRSKPGRILDAMTIRSKGACDGNIWWILGPSENDMFMLHSDPSLDR